MPSHPLAEVVSSQLQPPADAWWHKVVCGPAARDHWLVAFTGAGRRLGHRPLSLGERAAARLPAALTAVDTWTLSQLGRAALLRLACEALPPEQHVPLVDEAFRTGDLHEQVAVLRALPLLSDPQRFLDVAAAGVRTNARAILEALACDNPYPAAHFDQPAFNQLVMKAVFFELPLAQVVGLAERHNPELVRMALSYASERRAAGRSVPADLDLISGDPAT